MATFTDDILFQALKELNVIPEQKLTQAFESSKSQHISLNTVLIDQDLISDDNLGRTIADLFSLPFIRLAETSIPQDILQIIPEVIAKKQQIIAFKKDTHGLHVAMSNPNNIQIIEFIQKKTGLPLILYFATERDITNTLFLYRKDITKTFEEIIEGYVHQAANAGKHVDPPIIKMVDTILSYAYQNKASDIHVEPLKAKSLIRFRIDGILHDIVTLPVELHRPVVTRVKVLANLRTDEHLVSQDGKLQFSVDNESVDVRVSVVPITEGEKIVMRLLSEHARQFSLADLGLATRDLERVKKAYEKPYGMILTTGPTGSGKTTSIYAVLKLLNKRDVNIMTIEDPVEYDIEGINQIQVNSKTNLTFAEGLRSIVRQDPDIILVGEIRDEETADIAINSAMTGHLVLSTLHTNDSATSFPRLLDMKVEPFLIASTVNVIIAQRLVRKIHNNCRVSTETPTEQLLKYCDAALVKKIFGPEKTIRLYHGKGCSLDHGTGYEGRVGIFEVLVVNDDIRQAITQQKDATTIRKIAIKNGMTLMIEDGLEKAKEGLTTIEEVMRVTKE